MAGWWIMSIFTAASGFLPADLPGASGEARVTQIIREVKLLPAEAKPRAAAVNDKVDENTAVRTGDESRSELTFVDLTITRLGANTIFTFSDGGRNVRLNGGAVLLRVPKDSGGAKMKTDACSVAITGTTVILEAARSGRNKLSVLEGGARIWLNKNPKESTYVRAGQMVNVPPGATKMPAPEDMDVDLIMNKNPLITDFPPLPSRNLIYASRDRPAAPIYQGRPVGSQPGNSGPSFFPNILGVGSSNTPHYGGPNAGPGGGKKKKKLPNAPNKPNPDGPNIQGTPTPTPTPPGKLKLKNP